MRLECDNGLPMRGRVRAARAVQSLQRPQRTAVPGQLHERDRELPGERDADRRRVGGFPR